MLKFKKEYENQTVVLADGTLINRSTIASAHVQTRLTAAPWFGYMLESYTTTDPPVTGGGGAGDPRPPKKSTARTTKKK